MSGKLCHIFRNGERTGMTYEDLCHDLGVAPETNFVVVTTRGTITFSPQNPNGIKELYAAVVDGGYKPAKKFRQRCRTL